MKILVITAKYPPISGGAEKSLHSLIRNLQIRGHKTHVITKRQENRGREFENITITEIDKISSPMVEKYVREYKPDRILTQLEWNIEATEIGNKLGIPVVFFSRVGDVNRNADSLIFNSQFHQKEAINKFQLENYLSDVVYPLIEVEKYRKLQRNNPKFITIVNPVRAKGGQIAAQLAKYFPNEIFLGLKQWCDPELDNVKFEGNNVILLGYQIEMEYVYAHTKILLVPSQMLEPSPRVIVEAMSNNIPVLASEIGGIPEVMRGGGVLADPLNIEEWVSKLGKLLTNSSHYLKVQDSCVGALNKYSFHEEVDKAESLILNTKVRAGKDKYLHGKDSIYECIIGIEWFPDATKENT